MHKVMTAVICVLSMFTGMAQALTNSAIQYEYRVATPKTMVDVKVTPAMCFEVSNLAVGAKMLFDLNLSDEAIQNSMMNVAADNISDRVVWTAFHMVIGLDKIAEMRTWPNEAKFQALRKAAPGQDERLYFQGFAEQNCKDTQLDKTIKVLKVERRAIGSNTDFK